MNPRDLTFAMRFGRAAYERTPSDMIVSARRHDAAAREYETSTIAADQARARWHRTKAADLRRVAKVSSL